MILVFCYTIVGKKLKFEYSKQLLVVFNFYSILLLLYIYTYTKLGLLFLEK